MTTIYTIEITPHVDLTAGTLPLKVSGKPIVFSFDTVEARQPIAERIQSHFEVAHRDGAVIAFAH